MKSVSGRNVTIGQADHGAYHAIDPGVLALTPEMHIHVGPAANPDRVASAFVDRIFCIAE